ncbi:MAG: VOC family protein [Phycisphaerales bacterium]|nr:VOC family protein [Phycisphaerales bacterium]
MSATQPGSIGWHDLTVPDADRVRGFYERVVGWKSLPVSMGGYSDFAMTRGAGSEAVAGVCHARGGNADLPAVWMMYIVVEDLDAAVAGVGEAGGVVLTQPRAVGSGRFAVIRDPAGAVCALYQP